MFCENSIPESGKLNYNMWWICIAQECSTQWQPYSLDQTPHLISRRSRIVAARASVLEEIVATLEY